MAVVGIDLGTTNTVIAAVREGRATALKDRHGNALLPSVVSFTPKGTPKVGTAGKTRRTIDPENTVFSIKRLIGRTFDSEHVQKAKTRLPFLLKGGPGKSTLVSCYGIDHTLPEISALVLAEAQAIGEARLGEPVSDAVITVPANFNDLQRAATKVAGRTAGLEVLRIINEPTAAALAYGFGKRGQERIAVYDFGGGTFDVTLLDLRDNVFEVLSTAGDTFLGGDDVDRAILDRMAEELLRTQKIDAESDNLVREQLRVAAERIKIELSTRSMAKTRIDDLEFDFTMRRSEFEKLAEPLISRTLAVCKEAMEVADVSTKDLDQVLLVGGSTRIPLVRRRISSFFAKMPQSRINPDEVVAIGAAIQASALEAKQRRTSMIPAPRPRASARPDAAGASSTQMGLAGLRKTLAGTGRMSERPPEQQPVASVLSGLKSNSAGPHTNPSLRVSSPPITTRPDRPRAGTLAGTGYSEDQRENRPPGLSASSPHREMRSTSLGLGAGAPGPKIGTPPEASPHDFDDVTQVQKRADQQAAARDRAAESARGQARERQGTLRGAPMFPRHEGNSPSSVPPSGEGSVTFDLEDLEAEESDFDSLEDENTQIVDPSRADAQAAKLDSIADAEETEAELPSPVGSSQEPEELGDSALFALEEDDEDDDQQAGLPVPAAGLPAPVGSPRELGDSALFSLAPDDDEEIDLPTRSTRGNAPKETAVGLPAISAGLPSTRTPPGKTNASEAETRRTARRTDETQAPLDDAQVDLPLVGKGVPQKPEEPAVPTRPANLEASPFARKHGTAGGSANPLPAPSVDELDELSVSAPLPVDDEAEPEFELTGAKPPSSRQDSAAGLGQPSFAPPPQPSPPPSHPAPLSSRARDPASGAPPQDLRSQPAAPLLLDVTPLSLGVEVVGGYVDRLIERNSPVPCERTRTFATAQDNQQVVLVRVSQGEDGKFEANTVLGEVQLTGIPPGPRGSVKVDVSFSLDESGMLQVSARDTTTGNAANARLMLAGVAP